MVDKPAFPDPETAENALRLARTRGLGLAEATVFPWHPQMSAIGRLTEASEAGVTRATATLSFPPLPPDDFRYRAACGGGSLSDLGPYAAATNRLLFGAAPDRVHCTVLTRERGVDTSFGVLLAHGHGGSLAGHFGFVTAYQNRLSVLTRSRSIEAERVFTTPPDLACAVRVREDGADRAVPVAAADAFARFLEAFIGAVSRRDFEPFERALLEDAALVGRLRRAAGLEHGTVTTRTRDGNPPSERAGTLRVWDYRAEYEEEREEILAAVEQVLRSGRLILGESVRNFECELAAYCGAGRGVGVGNGTDALVLALRGLGIRPGDEVVTTSNTAIPTVSAIVTAGGVPRFVDVERGTYLMDVSQLAGALTDRTRCIVPVHLFGQCVAMDRVRALAGRHGIAVLEDCAQSAGAAQAGRRAGALATAAAFSFYPTKVLGAYGDGGMVVTSDEALADRVRRLRMYGTDGRYYAEEHGYNSRLDELHAEILRRKLRRLDGYVERRRALARRYDDALRDSGLELPRTAPGNRHAYYLYVVRHPARDAVIRGLAARGVIVNVSYPWPVHTMPAYAHPDCPAGSLPETEQAAKEIFSLPMYPALRDAEQDRVCEALLDVLRTLGTAGA